MRKTALLIGLISLALACKQGTGPVADSRMNDYALYDANGQFHRLSYYNNSEAIVLYIQGNGCPIVRNALYDFHRIVNEYEKEGFTFFMLNSNPQDNRSNTFKEASEFKIEVPVLLDSAQLLADEFDINSTAEVIILHPVSREVLWRGPINNRLDYEAQKVEPTETYLRDALEAIMAGSKDLNNEPTVRGCRVTRLSNLEKKDTLNYTDDIAPILIDHCVRCHREGGLAPWSMTDYQTIVGWSDMMKQVLLSKRMPPWKADPEIGEFSNSFAMADSNARKIVRWIDNGLEPGTGKDPLTEVKPATKQWQEGTPDQVISLNKEKIPATGIIAYRYQKFVLNPDKDVWIKGVEIQPGNAKVVHHIVLTNTKNTKSSPIVDRKTRPWTDNYIALGGGADQVTIFPEGTGVFVPKGSELTVQLHYTPTGKAEEDQTKFGFYYHEEAPETEFYALSPSNTDFTIPAFGKDVKLTVSDTISKDIKIHYLVPHMHYRGKSIKVTAIKPDGSEEVLVSVPDYNFNWQYLYKLKEPAALPKGSIVKVEGIYDNTFQNPFNPDPSQELHYGIQSTDEMLIGFFNYTLD